MRLHKSFRTCSPPSSIARLLHTIRTLLASSSGRPMSVTVYVKCSHNVQMYVPTHYVLTGIAPVLTERERERERVGEIERSLFAIS